MAKYYDEKCPQCEQGCRFFGYDTYPGGEIYERCGYFGYILTKFVDDTCVRYRTEEQWQRERELKKNNNKKTKTR